MIPMVLVVLKAPDQKAAHPEVGTPGASVAFAEAAAPSPSPSLHKAETLPAASGRKGTSIAVDDASYRSTSQPVLPVMMTMTSTVLGGVPLILSAGAGAEAREALGWVVVGGLGLATLSTLFLTPVAYLLLARFSTPKTAEEARLKQELQEARTV